MERLRKFLYQHPFLHGFLICISIGPDGDDFLNPDQVSDKEMRRQDWERVGLYLRNAISQIESEKSRTASNE